MPKRISYANGLLRVHFAEDEATTAVQGTTDDAADAITVTPPSTKASTAAIDELFRDICDNALDCELMIKLGAKNNSPDLAWTVWKYVQIDTDPTYAWIPVRDLVDITIAESSIIEPVKGGSLAGARALRIGPSSSGAASGDLDSSEYFAGASIILTAQVPAAVVNPTEVFSTSVDNV